VDSHPRPVGSNCYAAVASSRRQPSTQPIRM
jgi:hypothetical protein